MDKKQRFINYCENKIKKLGVLKSKEYISQKILYITNIKDGVVLVFFCPNMYFEDYCKDHFKNVGKMEFSKIDKNFYDFILRNWQVINFDKYII